MPERGDTDSTPGTGGELISTDTDANDDTTGEVRHVNVKRYTPPDGRLLLFTTKFTTWDARITLDNGNDVIDDNDEDTFESSTDQLTFADLIYVDIDTTP